MNRPDFKTCPGCEMPGICRSIRHCAGPRGHVSDATALAESSLAEKDALIAELAAALGAFVAPFDGDSAEVIEAETGPETAARVVAGRAVLAKARATS